MARLRAPKDAAFPRGRPRIIPFPARRAGETPKPTLEHHGYFLFRGEPIHLVGERWLAEDAANSPSPTYPDPMQPGIELTTRLEDINGELIQAVSYEQWAAYKLALLAGSTARPVEATGGRR